MNQFLNPILVHDVVSKLVNETASRVFVCAFWSVPKFACDQCFLVKK